jgi:uroporphyrinogen decarboxylase
MGLATNVDYATEVTLQPLERYPLDAAILFSDILTVPDAMGLGLSFAAGRRPALRAPVRDEAAVAKLAVPDMDKLRYVFDAVTSIRKALERPRAADRLFRQPLDAGLLHGRRAGLDDYRLVKTLMYAARPDAPHPGRQRRRRGAVPERADRRRRAGRDGVRQLGRRAGRWRFQAFSLAYTARVLAQLKRTGVDGSACRASSSPRAAACGWRHEGLRLRRAGPGLDHEPGHGAPRCRAGDFIAQAAPLARRCRATSTPTCCLPRPRRSAPRCAACSTALAAAHLRRDARPTHIFNLGHGISQFTPPEHVTWWTRCMPLAQLRTASAWARVHRPTPDARF